MHSLILMFYLFIINSMDSVIMNEKEMEEKIIAYLNNNNFSIDDFPLNFKIDELTQIYELYINNIEPKVILKKNHGWIAIYYGINKQYEKMIDYTKFNLHDFPTDKNAIKNMAFYLNENNNPIVTNNIFEYFNNENMENITIILKNKMEKIKKLKNEINLDYENDCDINNTSNTEASVNMVFGGKKIRHRKINRKTAKKSKSKSKPKTNQNVKFNKKIPNNISYNDSIINTGNVTINMLNEVQTIINNFKINNNISDVYNVYDKCESVGNINLEMKKLYLCNLIPLKNFTPSTNMINDILSFDFNNSAPLEIKLIKSVFSGCKINAQNINESSNDLNSMEKAITNNNFEQIHDLYNKCSNNNIKKIYLEKIMTIKDFNPSNQMINDTINLEFNCDSSSEIKLFKSIFEGVKI